MEVTKSFRTITLLILGSFILIVNACSTKPVNPSPSLMISDLAGTWTTQYTLGTTDTITINSDGTFNQLYEDTRKEYVFNSGWNQLTLEKLTSGITRLHLFGGRYYLEGISLAETNGRKKPDEPCLGTDCTWGLTPRSFYDPYAEEIVQMVDELLLVIQVDSRGNFMLHHIWTSSDRGFLLIDEDREIFSRK